MYLNMWILPERFLVDHFLEHVDFLPEHFLVHLLSIPVRLNTQFYLSSIFAFSTSSAFVL